MKQCKIKISEIKKLLDLGYHVEVESPDGFVEVSDFVDKGNWKEYRLTLNTGHVVSVNENHLFETDSGWIYAKNLVGVSSLFLTRSGFIPGVVTCTENLIPIVDIQVEHENHRYYTGEVSSHNTGVGKSLAMCHMAASNLMIGKNVLYITMEMSEEKIAERIDANLMNTPIQEMLLMDKETFDRKIERIKSKTVGKLVVKEYPTASAGSANFRHLLNELKMKRNFVPDVIYIDYLNICMSSRIKAGANVNSYTMIKAIAEELRGLAVEFNVPIITATQINRTGFASSDPELTDTSESFGLPATADFMIAMSQSEQLAELGQIMFKQLKNRYNDINYYKRFVVGVDKSKMRLFDIDQDEATTEDKPLMDKTEFGQQDYHRKKPKSKFANKFGDFK